MTKRIKIIFIFIIFCTIVLSSLANKIEVPAEDKANFKITTFIQDLLRKVQNLFFGKSYNKNNTSSVEKPLENKNLFQGDILLTENQADTIVDKVAEEAAEKGIDISKISENDTDVRLKRKIDGSAKKWDFPIEYYIKEGDEDLIDKALKKIENKTCIRFKKIDSINFERPSLRFVEKDGCWSYIGRKNDFYYQDISIGERCNTIGTIQHETMHALGLEHEQSRADRDDYLKIIHENIQEGEEQNFLKLEINNSITYGVKYDYGSNMQYKVQAFGKNNKETMIPYNGVYNKTLGLNAGMSFLDGKALNIHYCSEVCKEKLKCYNGGYQNPNKCGTCKCVSGYDGKRCTKFLKRKSECGEQFYNVTEKNTFLIFKGKKNCLYHLKAPHGKRIKISIVRIVGIPFYPTRCLKTNSVEIKFFKDKTTSGAYFCGVTNDTVLITENDHGIIHYRSEENHNMLNIYFKII
uniref:Zinc metalloproteinase n=1 Tax=Strongyloides stercoralis TaxID=6248 RepID=A0A0K0E2V2_STRER